MLIYIYIEPVNTTNNIKQEVRTVEYKSLELDENEFDDFDSHEIIQNDEGIDITAEKTFSMDLLSDLDLVGLDENSNEFVVNYELKYVENEDTVFLSATIVGDDDIDIIDTIPGLVSVNNAGESDIMFSVDGDLIWLSDLNNIIDTSVIDNTGWFNNVIKKLVKTATNTIVKVSSTLVSSVKLIVRPFLRVVTDFATGVFGKSFCAAFGAVVLEMKKDTEGIYHADFDCWQQYFGYSDFQDAAFDAGTRMRFGKFPFDVNGDDYDDYALWAWKGDYLNLGAGAEMGIYERWAYSDEIWKVDKSNAMKMTLKLEHKNKGTLFDWRPINKQWWITGFDYNVQNVNPNDLRATYTIEFTDINMYNCFKDKYKNRDTRWQFLGSNKAILTLDWI